MLVPSALIVEAPCRLLVGFLWTCFTLVSRSRYLFIWGTGTVVSTENRVTFRTRLRAWVGVSGVRGLSMVRDFKVRVRL